MITFFLPNNIFFAVFTSLCSIDGSLLFQDSAHLIEQLLTFLMSQVEKRAEFFDHISVFCLLPDPSETTQDYL